MDTHHMFAHTLCFAAIEAHPPSASPREALRADLHNQKRRAEDAKRRPSMFLLDSTLVAILLSVVTGL
jgi:hypothetical protein